MKWHKVTITRTPGERKEFKAVFTDETKKHRKTSRFGTASNYVLNKTKTDADREKYIARHRVNENWNDFTSPGALSRWILWGESKNWQKNAESFKRRFKLHPFVK